ncbi:MAG: transcriptional repressor [Bacteroidaceae bacterium]|nr:transcriptional repressor [Bacteroidaceae bacterium]
MVSRADLKQELLDAGIRPSVQRLAIFEYVRQSCQHPTAEIVFEALRDELGSLSLTTVYNTLKLFVDAGLISMLTIDDTFRCFDGNRSYHAHFRCNRCGDIVDLEMKKDFVSLVEGVDGYEIADAQLYLKGFCPKCKKIKK